MSFTAEKGFKSKYCFDLFNFLEKIYKQTLSLLILRHLEKIFEKFLNFKQN